MDVRKNRICPLKVLGFSLLLFFLLPGLVHGKWRIIPIRLDFDQRARSGVITLINEGDRKIHFSVDAVEWTQDEGGRDVYTATSDLIFFPKVLTIEPKRERIIRAGIRAPLGAREKAYRLFIREAGPRRESTETAVAISLQFGVPIFVKPALEDIKGELSQLAVAGDRARVIVNNSGNTHFRIRTVLFTGKDEQGKYIFTQEVSGWYLLSGNSASFSVPITAEIYRQLKRLEVMVEADRVKLHGSIDVDQAVRFPH